MQSPANLPASFTVRNGISLLECFQDLSTEQVRQVMALWRKSPPAHRRSGMGAALCLYRTRHLLGVLAANQEESKQPASHA